MRSFKNYLIAFLMATTVAGAYLAWQQTRELDALRAAAAKPDTDRAALRQRIWDAEKRTHALEAELASVRRGATSADTPTAATRQRRIEGPLFGMMDNPEYQKLMALQQKGMLDGRYAALFKSLKLTPQQLENFKRLLVEKQTSLMDVLAAARAQGLDPRADPDAVRQLISGAQAEIDESIKTAIGDGAYSQYKDYETTLPYRNMVSQLEQRLSYSSTPLTDTQSQEMLRIFAETAPAPAAGAQVATRVAGTAVFSGAGGGGNVFTMLGGGGGQISDEAVTRSQSVLSADQMGALQQLQQEHQAQAQLGQIMRSQLGSGGAAGAATTTTTVITAPAGR